MSCTTSVDIFPQITDSSICLPDIVEPQISSSASILSTGIQPTLSSNKIIQTATSVRLKPNRFIKPSCSTMSSPLIMSDRSSLTGSIPQRIKQRERRPSYSGVSDTTKRGRSPSRDSPLMSGRYQAGSRNTINDIVTELETNLATIGNPCAKKMAPSEVIDIKTKTIHSYNYAFNQVILQERATSSEKALLLRRIMEYYNSIIKDIPDASSTLENKEKEFSEKIRILEGENEEISKELDAQKRYEEAYKIEIEELQEKIKYLTEQSNQKDLAISSHSFDYDYLKGQIMQLQFKMQNKSEHKKMLKSLINKRDDEIKKQLEQIETLTKIIEEFQQGESGYIHKYHEKCKEFDEMKEKVAIITGELHNATHINKSDMCVDTSDLPQQVTKSHSVTRRSSKDVFTIQEFPSMTSKPIPGFASTSDKLSLNSAFKFNSNPSSESFNGAPSKGSDVGRAARRANAKKQHQLKINKTEIISSSDAQTSSQKVVNELIEQKKSESTQTDIIPVPEEPKPAPAPIIPECKDIIQTSQIEKMTFDYPKNYNVDHTKIDEIPDLLSVIMPFLSRPYAKQIRQDLRVLDGSGARHIVKNEKPLVWGLRIINSFLLDPYIRSVENINRTSVEMIFVDWINQQYKLQHIVNQIIADLSILMQRNRTMSPMIDFFCGIIESAFTINQVSFISTLYSFSLQFTYPSLSNYLQQMDSDQENFQIHIVSASKIISKCFTKEISDAFLLPKLKNMENGPMIDYFEFLSDAAIFFGVKHRHIYSQTKDLLWISGCIDPMLISYDPFTTFYTFLDFEDDIRKEWKLITSHTEMKDASTITMANLMSNLADRKKQFLKLMMMQPISNSISLLKNFSSVISDLFYDFISRYTRMRRQMLKKVAQNVLKEIGGDLKELTTGLLCADMPKVLWFYRLVLLKVDRGMMEEKGFIPFSPKSNSEVINQLVEYYDRTEAMAFAMLE